MAERDYYKILGVPRTASQDEIKRAFRKLARDYHPDVNPDDQAAEDRFKDVNAAFDVLGNPDRRALYDEFGSDGLRDGFDPEQARAYKRWASQARQGGGFEFRSSGPGGGGSSSFGDFGSVFSDLFGGGFNRQPSGPARGPDVEASISVDFLTAVRGGEVTLSLDAASDKVNVKIPPGIADGGRMRLSGKGQSGRQGGPNGDLYLTVNIRPHPSLRREGNDLYMTLPVTIGEAMRGAKVRLPTPDGATVSLTIPKRSQNGRTLRLKGKGVPDVKGGRTGDFYVVLDVRLPAATDSELDELAESFDKHYRDEAERPRQL